MREQIEKIISEMVDNYYDVGHSSGGVLWIYWNDKIHAEPVSDDSSDHTQFWSQDVVDRTFCGRYDPAKKVIGIKTPHYNARVPNRMLSALYDKFGSDNKIVEF